MTSGAETRIKQRIDRWLRADIRALTAYHVSNAKDMIKLDAMENPFPLPKALRGEWRQRLAQAEINRYPDPRAKALIKQVRTTFSVPLSCEMLLGNGSDELIQILALAVAGPGRTILAPQPSFSMYEIIAKISGSQFVGVPLREDYSLDGDAMLAAIAEFQPACVFLAYPNNPTGNLFAPDLIDAIINASDGLVVIDEAYNPFCDCSYLPRLSEFENVVVLRTLSKVGLAGLRLGMLFASKHWVDELDKLRLPYNINSLTQIAATFAIENYAAFQQQATEICHERERLAVELTALPGLRVYSSKANFILIHLANQNAPTVFAELKRRNILVKNLHQPDTPLANCLRLTIGCRTENDALLLALTEILK